MRAAKKDGPPPPDAAVEERRRRIAAAPRRQVKDAADTNCHPTPRGHWGWRSADSYIGTGCELEQQKEGTIQNPCNAEKENICGYN